MDHAISGIEEQHHPHLTLATALIALLLTTAFFSSGTSASPDSRSEMLREEMMLASMKHEPEGLVIRHGMGAHSRALQSHYRSYHRYSTHVHKEEAITDSMRTTRKHFSNPVMIRDFDDAGADGK